MKTKKKKMALKFIAKLFIALNLILFMGFGCGSNGSGDSSDKKDITTTSSENEKIEAALSATIKVIEKGQKEQKVNNINDSVPFMQKKGSTIGSFDSCFTMDTNQAGMTITFNDSAGCDGMSGSISITASNDGKTVVSTYQNVEVLGDGCIINGKVIMTFSESGSFSDMTTSYENLDICGEIIDGTTYGSYNTDTDEYVVTMDGESVTIDLNGGAISGTLETDINFNDDGYAEGSAEIIIADQIYTCTIDDVIINPTCDIPTSGTINISDGTNTIMVDFSNTDCENSTIIYTFNGEEFTYNPDVNVEIEP